MLVKEMIKAISNKELKVIDLAEKYGFSDRTIQTKIKNLGFEWDSVKGEYTFTGTDESVYELAVDNVFKKKARTSSKKEAKSEVEKAGKEVAGTLQNYNENRPEISNKSNIKNEVKKSNKKVSIKDNDKVSENKIRRPSIFDGDAYSDYARERNAQLAREKANDKAIDQNSDTIDLLLSGQKPKRTSKAFYLDHDVLQIIESVDSGVRSDLVNECLRKVFKEKGLL